MVQLRLALALLLLAPVSAAAQAPLMQPILEGDPAMVAPIPENPDIPPSEDMLQTEEAPSPPPTEEMQKVPPVETAPDVDAADIEEDALDEILLMEEMNEEPSAITDITEDESFVFDDEIEMRDYPYVRLRALDKITARVAIIEAQVGVPIRFGRIFMKTQACRKPPPLEKTEAAAFLQIWESDIKGESQWAFSGWMFASSPALSAMDHPIYDVWVLDCLEKRTTTEEEGIF